MLAVIRFQQSKDTKENGGSMNYYSSTLEALAMKVILADSVNGGSTQSSGADCGE